MSSRCTTGGRGVQIQHVHNGEAVIQMHHGGRGAVCERHSPLHVHTAQKVATPFGHPISC